MNMREIINLIEAAMLAYHGSRQDGGPNFQLGHTGDNSHTFCAYQSKRYGAFFTDNPAFAAIYGDVREYSLSIDHTLDLDGDHSIVQQFIETLDPFGADRPLWLSAKYAKSVWQLFEEDVGQRFVAFLSDQGYDSAKFVEYNEDATGEEQRSTTIVVFETHSDKIKLLPWVGNN